MEYVLGGEEKKMHMELTRCHSGLNIMANGSMIAWFDFAGVLHLASGVAEELGFPHDDRGYLKIVPPQQ